MIVPLFALAAALFYAANVPVCVRVDLDLKSRVSFWVRAGLFRPGGLVFPKSGNPQKKMPADAASAALELLRHVQITRVRMRVALWDASETALIAGGANALLNAMHIRHSIRADFNPAVPELFFDGIASVKAGYIIVALAKLISRNAAGRIFHGKASN